MQKHKLALSVMVCDLTFFDKKCLIYYETLMCTAWFWLFNPQGNHVCLTLFVLPCCKHDFKWFYILEPEINIVSSKM